MSAMNTRMLRGFVVGVVLILIAPDTLLAKTGESFEISGWIPYWRAEKGLESILPNIGKFTEVNPFVYSVKQDGSLYLSSPLDTGEWATLRTKAKEAGVRFIPTIMWANADAMDEVFRDPAKRTEHVRAIAHEVYARNLEGVDIDYEGKYARTRPYFSLFLKELYAAIGYDKWVMCTIEARTPLDSRYSSPESIPKDIEYANDFPEINKYCDRVRFMTYDQGRYDLKLNDANADPYVPVADKAWVEKTIRLAAEEIDKDKIVIGVATYGYEYDMFLDLGGSGEMQYSRLWSFNPGYVTETVTKLGLTPTRNSAGEMFLIYPASQSVDPAIPLPNATRVMSWSDAESIRQKAELAKQLGVRGIAIFKIDGGQDPVLWSVLTAYEGGAAVAEPAATTPSMSNLSIPKLDLQFGARREEVRALQKLLNAHGFTIAASGGGSPGNETTYFGPATRTALIRFQKQNSITPAAGYFGPKTRAVFASLQS